MSEDSNALNVLMVTPRYFPYTGGIETHVHEVGLRLVRDGINVTLLTTAPQRPTAPLPREVEVEGMRVIRVQAWPKQRDYYIAPEIHSIIQHGNWDIIHCQGCHTFVPPLAMLAARRAGIPYVLTFHTGGHASRIRNSLRGMQWRALRPLLAHASKLIGVSQFEAEYFRKALHLPKKQFTVIPNGATLPNWTPPSSTMISQPLIVSVGRLERYKGHQHLITALPKIRERCPEAELLILGVGPYEATLRELAQAVGVAHNVKIGSVAASNREGMAAILSRASLVALLSEYEAHPVAIMEALSLRRPVLVANTAGLREIAEKGLALAIPLNSSPQEVASAALQQIEEPIVPPEHLALPTWDACSEQLQAIYHTFARRTQCVS
jgi:glycosyltransferase involved in cell wall biosynthesis